MSYQNFNLVIQYIYKQRKDLQNLETDKKTFQVKNIFSQIYACITNCLVLILVPYTFSKLVITLCLISCNNPIDKDRLRIRRHFSS